MNTRRGGLGRGLGALIPTAPATGRDDAAVSASSDETRDSVAADADARGKRRDVSGSVELAVRPDAARRGMVPVPGATFAQVKVHDIRANPKQPRQVFDEGALDELAHSLREVGFLQPVVVRPVAVEPTDHAATAHRYELVMGERRWRAAQQAGFDAIPAIIRQTSDDALLRDALLENLHREQLNPLEEGAAYAQLLEEFGATHDELAKRIGRSRSQVSNTIRLLHLPAQVQLKVAAGVLSAGHARALLSLADGEAQERLAARVVSEGLSVRAVEELVAVGDGAHERARARRAPKHRAPALDNLAARLSDRFETRVRVDLGRNRGKITIEFASIDDLERIVATMAPDVSGAAASATA